MLSLIRAQWRSIAERILLQSPFGLSKRLSLSIRLHRAIGLEERVQLGYPTARSYVTSPQTVQQLVEEGEYKQAGVMLVELQTLRTAVSPHPVYAKAVEHLLSQGKLGDKDREILCYWLQLLPDARYTNPLFFQGCADVFRRHTKDDSRFITTTGGILARKGYKGLIEDDILPLAKEYLELDVFTHFKHDVSQALARYDHECSSSSFDGVKPSEVFEDASEDYISIMTTSTHSPSILEVVETSLPPILPAPDINGQSVFEDEMDEDYVIHQSIGRHPRQSATDQLLHLVALEKYQDALHLLKELQQLHATIPSSDAYGYAALDALHRPLSDNFTLDDQLELFTTWFSLVPTAGTPRTSPTSIIQVNLRKLMNDPLTNMTLMGRCFLILAEKGYQGFVGRQEIGFFMRFASQNEAVPFIHQLENAYLSYCEKHSQEVTADTWYRFRSQLRSRAIRHLAYAGRVEEAVSLLPQGDSGFQISLYTCEKLLRTVRDARNPSSVQYLHRIEALYEQLSITDEMHKLRQLHLKAEDEIMMNQLGASGPDAQIGKPLPETLRYLKRILRSAEEPPHPTIIVEFLQRYLATGRTRAPTLLLNLSIKTSYRNYSAFLFAEMIYYRLMGQHYLIIKTFVDHFYLSGVPRINVLRIYDRLERLRSHHQTSDPTNPYPMAAFEQSEPNALTRICNYTGLGPTGLPIGKAWPMKIHCNLVWHALVALTPTDQELEVLYRKLLLLARGRDQLDSSNKSLEKLRPLLPPPSWRTHIDCAAFTPFMRRLMIHAGAARGSRIIQDMVELDIEPSIYHYTELTGFYAKMGEVEIVMKILRFLEDESGLYERLERQKHNHSPDLVRGLVTVSSNPYPATPPPGSNSDSSEPRVHTAPEPDLVFYTSLMRGFILSRNKWGFERVHGVLRFMKQSLPNKKFYKDQEATLNGVYGDYRIMMHRRPEYDYKAKRRSKFVQFMQTQSTRKS